LEPVDVEWLMSRYRRGISDEKLRREIQVLGCSPGQAQQLHMLIARETGRGGLRDVPTGRPLRGSPPRWARGGA
jgi:hypothetical protein